MTKVYEWPPVRALSREWTVHDPIAKSQSLITGAEFISAAQRRRRIAVIEASSMFAPNGAGAGYMEALKRLLQGGVNLVRIRHRPTTFYCSGQEAFGWVIPPEGFEWILPIDGISWTTDGADPLIGTLTSDDGFPAVAVEGVPPNTLIATVGEYVSVGGESHMVLAPAISDDDGNVAIRLVTQPSSDGIVSLGTTDIGVFKADEMPRAVQPATGDWSYTWSFTEVFEDERGPFEDIDPWN